MADTLSHVEDMPPAMAGRADLKPLEPVAQEDDLAFHALLTPNRSLTRGGFIQVMVVIALVNVVNAVVYATLGAWPVVFFCILDIFIVWGAFKLSYRQGRRHERLMLTDDTLWVARVLPSGHEMRWRLTPSFVRVEMDRPADHHSQLRLSEKGKTLIVGSFLAPHERVEVADALLTALKPYRG